MLPHLFPAEKGKRYRYLVLICKLPGTFLPGTDSLCTLPGICNSAAPCTEKAKNVCKPALAGTICACILCTASIVYFGAQTPAGAKRYIDQAIDPEQEVSLSVDSNHFFRIDISENCDNYPMLWKLPCMRTFHSIVPASIMEFYHAIGVTRDVASRADLSYYTLRGLFSVQYYYDQIAEIDLSTESDPQSIALPGFSYRNTENGFRVYENTAYVPMGFTFDQYITESDWEACADNKRASLLMHAIVLNDRQVEQYGSNMQRMDSDHTTCTKEHYLEDCAARTASSCDSLPMIPMVSLPPFLQNPTTWYFSVYPMKQDGRLPSMESQSPLNKWTLALWRFR